MEKITLSREDFAWLVEQSQKAADPNSRLQQAMDDLARLTQKRPDGTVVIEWLPRTKAKAKVELALLPGGEGPLAATPEAQTEQILGLATWLNMGQRDRAVRWFEAPLSELGNKSPRQLVAEGHADGVLDYMLGLITGTIG